MPVYRCPGVNTGTAVFWCKARRNGAEGRSRTDTPAKELDFESSASTSFATPATVAEYNGTAR